MWDSKSAFVSGFAVFFEKNEEKSKGDNKASNAGYYPFPSFAGIHFVQNDIFKNNKEECAE